MFALLAGVKSFYSIMKFIYAVMQIADATACSIRLTGDLSIMLKEIVQGTNHFFEVKATAMTVMPSLVGGSFQRRQCPGDIICAHLAPVQV